MSALRALLVETGTQTGFAVHRLVGPERTRALSRARFAFSWAAQQRLAATKRMIGAELGQADHTSAVHAIKRAEQLRASDQAFRNLTDRLVASAKEQSDG